MAKKKIAPRTRNANRLTYPRAPKLSATAPQPKTATEGSSPPVPTPEPTFTLPEIREAFGFNFGLAEDAGDPLCFARNALDDARRSLRLVEECLHACVDAAVLIGVVCNAAKRAEVADDILFRFAYPNAPAAAGTVQS